MANDTVRVTDPRSPSVDLSVIIPAYNTGPLLEILLKSIIDQRIDTIKFEVIAIDDGSTDGSGEILDEYARIYSWLRVIHQDNSGWPGKPRNRGLDLATGRYVFFADADDSFGSEAFERMIKHADNFRSDVLLVKVVGTNGRRTGEKLFTRTIPDASLDIVGVHLGPVKLFRRSLVEAHNLRFPEGVVPSEDGMFVLPAYYASRRISVVSDYTYYYAHLRDDKENISRRPKDPVSYTKSARILAGIIESRESDRNRRDRLISRIFRRKCLRRYRGRAFTTLDTRRRESFVHEHKKFQDEFVPESVELLLSDMDFRRSRLIRQEDVSGLLDLSHRFVPGLIRASTVRIRKGLRNVKVFIKIESASALPVVGPHNLHLRVRMTEPNDETIVSLHPLGDGEYRGVIRYTKLEKLAERGEIDFYVSGLVDRRWRHARLKWLNRDINGSLSQMTFSRHVRFYRTRQGNLSGSSDLLS